MMVSSVPEAAYEVNPWAPARYGTWVESTSFDPNHPGKWNGIKLFEIIF